MKKKIYSQTVSINKSSFKSIYNKTEIHLKDSSTQFILILNFGKTGKFRNLLAKIFI